MKKIFLVVAALGMLATSCTKDDAAVAGGESLVSFTIDSPELMTRAEDGKGQSTNHLQYAFYDENGVYLPALKGEVANFVGSTKINISLVEGRTYSAIFWADHTDAPYEVDLEHKTMEITATEFDGNADKYDAFYKYQTNIDPAQKTHHIELTRPFAQINIATADKTKAANAGFDAVATKVTVRAHSTLNLATGVVATDDYATFTYKWAALPTSPATATVGSQSYDMLAMNYVLVNDRELVDVKMEVSEVAAGDNAIERNYTTVPVQRNYRTYIVGNLLTTTNEFNVTTVPGFEDDDEEYGVIDGQVYHEVDSTPEFIAALEDEDVDMVILTGDINLNDPTMRSTEDEDKTITIAADREFTIDLGGHKLSATSAQTGKNYNMFDVRGTLTVKNGTMEYKHEGENMGWNNFAEIFYVGFNGTLNLEGVTAKNLGGSDMAYVIDMVNATNITVNVKNSTLESTYIPVRVFNNSKTGVNNVSIKNSTLKGKFCFWVQYWLADGRDEATLKQTLKLDILNGTNTFECTGAAPILYGFNDTIYYSVVNTAEELAAAFAEGGAYALNKNINTEDSFKVAKDIVLDLAGHTISGTDKATGNYALIEVQPDVNFEITNTAAENGKLTVVATNNRNWNAYSSVVSNQRGTLTVGEGVVIEHLGGTDMAYGIDNLTNTGNQKAIATINGATVKSPYRAIRQFLNSTAEGVNNELYVNSGVIEGANKSIWMQDANAKANPGKLVVAAAAQLKGDVYLTVTAGSKEWPVEVSVASAALVGESTVLTSNVPVQYEVVEKNGTWVVNESEGTVVSTAAELADALEAKASVILLNAGVYEGTFHVNHDARIKGNGATIKGRVEVVSTSATFQNVKFDYNEASLVEFSSAIKDNPKGHPAIVGIYGNTDHVVTFEKCEYNFKSGYSFAKAPGVITHYGGVKLVLNGCVLDGEGNPIYAKSNIEMENCHVKMYGNNAVLNLNYDEAIHRVVFKNNVMENKSTNGSKMYAMQFLSTNGKAYSNMYFDVQGNTGVDVYFSTAGSGYTFNGVTYAEGSETL